MRQFMRSLRSALVRWSVPALGLSMLGAFGIGVTFLVIGIVLDLDPLFSVAGLLCSLAVVTVFGVLFVDALARRKNDHHDHRR